MYHSDLGERACKKCQINHRNIGVRLHKTTPEDASVKKATGSEFSELKKLKADKYSEQVWHGLYEFV